MQTAVPELMDIAGESERDAQAYGLDSTYAPTHIFGRNA